MIEYLTMHQPTLNNRRIAKNTFILYVRMGVTMLVQLYTSRVILDILGVQDYGVWSLVATLVISISFITGPLSSATQRFLSYEIGKKNHEKLRLIFSQSMILYMFFGLILLLIFETIGMWILNSKLSLPENMNQIVNIVYQLSILTFLISIVRMPYDSLIIANEDMSFYAYVSIIEVSLKLGIVYLLVYFKGISNLILYSLLTLAVVCIITLLYKYYCNRKYAISQFEFCIDKPIIREMASFSGWNLIGAFAVMTSSQGVNMVLNVFCGVTLNATMGIANQVSNAVNQFASNFQTAFQPQIVKLYAAHELGQLHTLIYQASRISFLLLFAISFPILVNITGILHLWLGDNVPPFASQFCSWILVAMLIDCLSAPLWMSINATGNIRNYQLAICTSLLINIIGTYIALYYDMPPISVVIIKCLVSVLCLVVRLKYANKMCGVKVYSFARNVIVRMAIVSIIVIMTDCFASFWLLTMSPTIQVVLQFMLFLIVYGVSSLYIGLYREERIFIFNLVKTKIRNTKENKSNLN